MTTHRRRPDVYSPAGRALVSSAETGASPHHLITRNGSDVSQRLQQASLYRPDLDLTVLDTTGEVATYGLFWFDPTTEVGFVQPMATNETHRRKGLARHILTSTNDQRQRVGHRVIGSLGCRIVREMGVGRCLMDPDGRWGRTRRATITIRCPCS